MFCKITPKLSVGVLSIFSSAVLAPLEFHKSRGEPLRHMLIDASLDEQKTRSDRCIDDIKGFSISTLLHLVLMRNECGSRDEDPLSTSLKAHA
jgi:hypothetical protein